MIPNMACRADGCIWRTVTAEQRDACRGQGIAGKLLDHVCRDMLEKGIDTLYLITDHTSFYERYGWKFLCLVEEEEGGLCRMYVHRENGRK